MALPAVGDEAELYLLTERSRASYKAGRYAVAAAQLSRAEAIASALYRDGASLVVVHLRMNRSQALMMQSDVEGVPASEKATLRREMWTLEKSVILLVERREAAGTLVRPLVASLMKLGHTLT